MSSSTVWFYIATGAGGAQTGLTVLLSDPEGDYGVKNNDGDAVVVADATEMTEVGGGIYSYQFTDPAADLTYTAYAEFAIEGETHHVSKVFTGSTSGTEPVTVDEAKTHMRVDIDDDDDLIGVLVGAAREYAETVLNRRLLTETKTQYFDAFANEMELKKPPLQSVTGISYVDTDGDDQDLDEDTYDVDINVEPRVIRLAYDQSWPDIRNTPNAVTVTYVAGYGDATDVPDSIKQMILMLVAHWYENREASLVGTSITPVPLAVESLMWANRVPEVA